MRKNGPRTFDLTFPPAPNKVPVYTSLDGVGLICELVAWGLGVQEGDYIILENPLPPALQRVGDVQVINTTRYRVEHIEYSDGVADMFRARIKFFPRAGRMPSRDY